MIFLNKDMYRVMNIRPCGGNILNRSYLLGLFLFLFCIDDLYYKNIVNGLILNTKSPNIFGSGVVEGTNGDKYPVDGYHNVNGGRKNISRSSLSDLAFLGKFRRGGVDKSWYSNGGSGDGGGGGVDGGDVGCYGGGYCGGYGAGCVGGHGGGYGGVGLLPSGSKECAIISIPVEVALHPAVHEAITHVTKISKRIERSLILGVCTAGTSIALALALPKFFLYDNKKNYLFIPTCVAICMPFFLLLFTNYFFENNYAFLHNRDIYKKRKIYNTSYILNNNKAQKNKS